VKSVIPWSFSSYNHYQTCPRQFYETKIAQNFVEEPTVHTVWGKEVHSALEQRALTGAELPHSMDRFKHVADRIIGAPGDTYVELELAVDVNLIPVEFNDPNAWCRGIGDLIKVNGHAALANDWKTGKRKPASLQLDLMGVLVFATFPAVEKVITLFTWFQEPSKPTSKIIQRADIPKTMDQFAKGVADMQWSEENNVWPEKPSGLCRGYCAVKTCKYWQPKRNR
jgi:hypothetical protein